MLPYVPAAFCYSRAFSTISLTASPSRKYPSDRAARSESLGKMPVRQLLWCEKASPSFEALENTEILAYFACNAHTFPYSLLQ